MSKTPLRRFLSLLFFVVCSNFLYAQAYHFARLGQKEGLPNEAVSSLAQDNNAPLSREGFKTPKTVHPLFFANVPTFIAYGLIAFLLWLTLVYWTRHKFCLKASEKELERRRLLEGELTRARDDAERAKMAKTEFLANISHEMRTPLNAIIGYTAMLLKMQQTSQNIELLSIIDRSSRNLLGLINDSLDLSRLESGKIDIHLEQFSVHILVTELTELFQFRLREKPIILKADVSQEVPPSILHDKMRLRQILINLLGNAIKFTKIGRVALTVSYEIGKDDREFIYFEVQDSGSGIKKEHLERVFTPFYQDPEHGTPFGGTGLGLSIVEKLCRDLGGEIKVTSEYGKGSCFTVKLPVFDGGLEDIEQSSKLLGAENIHWDFDEIDKEPPVIPLLALNKEDLALDLGSKKTQELLDAGRRQLLPKIKGLSKIILTDEWEALFEEAELLYHKWPSRALANWIQESQEALGRFDSNTLNELKRNIEHFLEQHEEKT